VSQGVRSKHDDVSSLDSSTVEHSIDDGADELEEFEGERVRFNEERSTSLQRADDRDEAERAYGDAEL